MTWIAILLTLFLVLLCYMYVEAKRQVLVHKKIKLPQLPRGFVGKRFLFVSDFHSAQLTKTIKQQLKKEKIDIVLIGGDLTEKDNSLKRVKENIDYLTSLAPCYFVWGNHDYNADYHALDILLQENRVHMLANDAVLFEADEDKLWLIGVDEVSNQRDNLPFAMAAITEPGYRMLLAHNPLIMLKVKEEDNIGAVFCGHTHGGQIRIPILERFILGRYYRKYIAGEYWFFQKKCKLFVGRGIGTSHLPFRLGAPAEVYLLQLDTIE